MKVANLIPLIIFIAACDSAPKVPLVLHTVKPKTKTILIPDTTKVNISTTLDNTVFSTRAEIASVLKHNPELNDGNHYFSPYTLYNMRGLAGEGRQNGDDKIDFSSEVGQDNYFFFYAYFLSQRNGLEKYKVQRAKLIKLYSALVNTFLKMDNGGSTPSHQYPRLTGVAEYSVYLYKYDGGERYKKQYNFAKQKALYIKSLKQFIEDECSTDYDVSAEDKQKMFKTVKEIDGLITEYFYLERALAFQYSD